MEIHLGRNGQELGTFDENAIRTGLENGQILISDLAWCEGEENWMALGIFADKHQIPLLECEANTASNKGKQLSRDTERFRKIVERISGSTRFSEADIELLSDTREQITSHVTLTQTISFSISSSSGTGKGLGVQQGSILEIEQSALEELKRYGGAVPSRIKHWLATAQTQFGVGMWPSFFDAEAKTFTYSWDCETCSATGKLVCKTCEFTGKVTCPDCSSTKAIVCPLCSGKGSVTCPTCQGKGREDCSRCQGTGLLQCTATSCRNGKVYCIPCGGRGWLDQPATAADYESYHGPKGTIECYHCHGVGSKPCYTCHSSGKMRCYHCQDGTLRCEQCRGDKLVDCGLCSGKGIVSCATCDVDGKVICNACKGTKFIECKKCGSTGTHYQSRHAKATVSDVYKTYYSESVPKDIERLLSQIPVDKYPTEGVACFDRQSLLDSAEASIIRRWNVEFSVWRLKVRIAGQQFEFIAYGTSQKIFDVNQAIEKLLVGDRVEIEAALKEGPRDRVISALQTYFKSANHVQEMVAPFTGNSGAPSPLRKRIFDWMHQDNRRLLVFGKVVSVMLLVCGYLPAFLKLGFSYAWAYYLSLPVIAYWVGKSFSSTLISRNSLRISGNQKVADFLNVESSPEHLRHPIVYGVSLGLLSLVFVHCVLYGQPWKGVLRLPDYKYLNVIQAQKRLNESASSIAMPNNKFFGLWRGTYFCNRQTQGELMVSITERGSVFLFRPKNSNVASCFAGKVTYVREGNNFDVSSGAWISNPISAMGGLRPSGLIVPAKGNGQDQLEGILEERCFSFKAKRFAPPIQLSAPCNWN